MVCFSVVSDLLLNIYFLWKEFICLNSMKWLISSHLVLNTKRRCTLLERFRADFNKREGKASENAILTSRVIDRPMRPLFPKDYRNDVTLVNMVMSVDGLQPGADCNAWFCDRNCYFWYPVWRTDCYNTDRSDRWRIFVFNPTSAQRQVSDMALTVASTRAKSHHDRSRCKWSTGR